jgi:hypothetical protein
VETSRLISRFLHKVSEKGTQIRLLLLNSKRQTLLGRISIYP